MAAAAPSEGRFNWGLTNFDGAGCGGGAEAPRRRVAAPAPPSCLEEGDDDRVCADEPPRLKSNRCCCSSLLSAWMLFSTGFFVLTMANVSMARFGDGSDAALERHIARDPNISDYVSFGVWDAHSSITPLQLQVALSMALGVRAEDDDVHVGAEEDFFFTIKLDHGTAEECDYIGKSVFLAHLNSHLTHYGGSAVLSRPPRLHKRVLEKV